MGTPRVMIRPGDITVNYLLAFFSLILAPLFILLDPYLEYLGRYDQPTRLLFIICVIVLAFMLCLKTKLGINMIQKLVDYIKKTELQ